MRKMPPSFFNNCNASTNGEMLLWSVLKPNCKVMFDVGCREDDYYVKHQNETQFHLFEPHPSFFNVIASKVSAYSNVKVNNIGLGSTESIIPYYEKAQSFVNRWNESPSRAIPITTIDTYCTDNNINHIDFLKIDTEGFEIDVLMGCKNKLNTITHIQFEYGGTYPDRGVTLSDVYTLLNGRHIFLLGSDGLYHEPLPKEHLQYSNYLATNNPQQVSSIIKH